MEEILLYFQFIGSGILITLQLAIGGLLLGMILSIPASILRHQGFCTIPLSAIISVIRGTPLILQISFIYFAIPGFTGIQLHVVTAGILTFGLNSFAYLSEIIRSGISSIPKEQFEVSQTLKIPKYYMWKDIILPQVIRNTLPTWTNEAITLMKETALISTIGGMDIMRSAQIIAAVKFTYFLPLCVAGVYYYVMSISFERIGKMLEQYYDYS